MLFSEWLILVLQMATFPLCPLVSSLFSTELEFLSLPIKKILIWVLMAHNFDPRIWDGDRKISEFKVKLVYRASSRKTRDTQRKPICGKNKTKQTNKKPIVLIPYHSGFI